MRIWWLAAAFAALVAGYSGYWFYLAGEIEAGIERWIAARAADGLEAGHEGIAVAGFPFRLEVAVAGARLALPDHPMRPRLAGGRVRAVSQPWNLKHWLIAIDDRFRFGYRAETGPVDLAVSIDDLLASIRYGRDGDLRRFSLQFEAFEIGAEQPELRLENAQVHLLPHNEALTTDLALSAARLSWPPALTGPLGASVQALDVQAAIVGWSPRAPAASLADWRDRAGRIDVRKAALRYDRIGIGLGAGSLALDDQMRLSGRLPATVVGHGELVAALVRFGVLSEFAGNMARIGLALIANSGDGSVSAPLVLQDGQASLGPVLLGRLTPLRVSPPPPGDRSPSSASPDRLR